MVEQRYVSQQLIHFVGRKEPDDDARYALLRRIIKSGWLVSGAMARTPIEDLPSRIQQVSYGYPLNLANIDLNTAFVSDVVFFADIPQQDLGLHMRKYGRFGLSFTKEYLLTKGGNPVFYISKRSTDQSEGGATFDTLFRRELQNYIDINNSFQAGLRNIGRMYTQNERSQFKIHIFLLKYFVSFLKFWNHTDDDKKEDNYYMEREWRVFGGFQFAITDVQKIVLPSQYASAFRNDFPDYANELSFADIAA